MFHGRKQTLLAAVVFSFSVAVFAAGEPEAVPGEYIVVLKKSQGIRSAQLATALRGEDVSVVSKSHNIYKVKRNILELGAYAVADISKSDAVQSVEPNYIYSIVKTPNDPNLGELWGLVNDGKNGGNAGVDIGAQAAWDIATGSKDVIVGVIDTGVDYTLEDLAENMWVNEAEKNGKPNVDDDKNGYVDDVYGYDFANNDGDPLDDHGHGSHVSGTIGAKGNDGKGIVGVNWNVRIMALKFLTASGSGTLEGAIKAVEYAIKNGAHITNNSWGGGGFSDALYNIIGEAGKANQLFVAAAGNNGSNSDASPMYPAAYDHDNIISVAALDNTGAVASFSNYGIVSVDVAAPGVNITSCTPGGYKAWNGTSMASPHVAGIAALLLSNEALSAVEIKERILATAVPMASLAGKTSTSAMANAYYALTNTQAPPDPNDPKNWKSKEYTLSTAHPYADAATQEWVVTSPGASRISVYFEKFETEAGYDKVSFHDANGNQIAVWSGMKDKQFTPSVEGDTMIIRFVSDQSVNKYGFDITKIAVDDGDK